MIFFIKLCLPKAILTYYIFHDSFYWSVLVLFCFGLPWGKTQITFIGLETVKQEMASLETLPGQLLLKDAISMQHDRCSNNRLLMRQENYPERASHCHRNSYKDKPQPASYPYDLHSIGAKGLW